MYAVVKTGGKQYRVNHGDKLKVELLKSAEGDSVTLDQVLMVGNGDDVTVGSPLVDGASVTAKVLSHGRGKKVHIVKFRRRKHHRKQMGHRQSYTELEITGISANGVNSEAPVKEEKKAPKPAPKAEEKEPEAPAAAAPLKFSDGPVGEPDDLTEVNGIGPVISAKLNEMGIYHFHQLADFNEEQIEQVNEELAFPGRIEREEWIAQAKELAKTDD